MLAKSHQDEVILGQYGSRILGFGDQRTAFLEARVKHLHNVQSHGFSLLPRDALTPVRVKIAFTLARQSLYFGAQSSPGRYLTRWRGMPD
jgi:hypothetical protein